MPIRRREFLGAAVPWFTPARARQANLLFLMSDQHRRGASGCYGHREVHTPHVDRIAAAGVRLDRAYCQAPVCVPSRGSLITGLYPHAHGARILEDPLPGDARTIAHFFRERGYATGAIGKMHFVDETRRHGFDHRLHAGDFAATLDPAARRLIREDQGNAGGVDGRPSRLPAELFPDHYYAGQAVDFLRRHRDRPFCLWVSFERPHTPLVPERRFWDLYDAAALNLPRRTARELENGFPGHLARARERGWYTQTDAELRRSLAGYYGNISQMDHCAGRVYEALCGLGLDRNTVVVYTSDHGEMAGAHRMWTKHNMFEESVGVPLIVSAPGLAAGTSRSDLIEQVDLFPTLAELCGLGRVPGVHGRSFAALLQGHPYTPREYAYSEYYFCRKVFTRDDRYVGKPPLLMVRTDRWKLNYLEWGRSELYDMEKDPGEFRNAIDEPGNAGIVRELAAIARRNYARGPSR